MSGALMTPLTEVLIPHPPLRIGYTMITQTTPNPQHAEPGASVGGFSQP